MKTDSRLFETKTHTRSDHSQFRFFELAAIKLETEVRKRGVDQGKGKEKERDPCQRRSKSGRNQCGVLLGGRKVLHQACCMPFIGASTHSALSHIKNRYENGIKWYVHYYAHRVHIHEEHLHIRKRCRKSLEVKKTITISMRSDFLKKKSLGCHYLFTISFLPLVI